MNSFEIEQYFIDITKYRNGCVAVLVSDETGLPFTVLSECVPSVNLGENEFVLNHNLLDLFKDFLNLMLSSKCFEDTGRTASFHFCQDIPIWKLIRSE
jgi:hypothetical protein